MQLAAFPITDFDIDTVVVGLVVVVVVVAAAATTTTTTTTDIAIIPVGSSYRTDVF